jgi:hypothetical protein
MQEAANGHLRSMLVTVTGISTRNRVLLRRVDRGVIISICENSNRPQAQGEARIYFEDPNGSTEGRVLKPLYETSL